MKFNPIKRTLYADNGDLITKLACPFKVDLPEGELLSTPDKIRCDICNGEIVDTSGLNEEEIIKLTQTSSHLCLKIDPTQANVRIVYMR